MNARVNGPTAKPQLREVADGVFAYLQSGGWGYSNAGLVTSGGHSLLIDTLYDQTLTASMLEAMRGVHRGGIDTLVNTHANGDHCWGNASVTGAKIVSSRHTAQEMLELSPKLMHTLVSSSHAVQNSALLRAALRIGARLRIPRTAALLEAAPFVVRHFGAFDFGAVTMRVPDTTFDAQLSLDVAGRRVELFELGPAHTRGDVIAFVPDARVVFTGDLLFAGSHPIAWDGPIEGWIAACDRILALDADVVVAGHGALSTMREIEETKRYWVELLADVRQALDSGLAVEQVGKALSAKHARDWNEACRLVVNADTIARGMMPGRAKQDPLSLLAAMGRYERDVLGIS